MMAPRTMQTQADRLAEYMKRAAEARSNGDKATDASVKRDFYKLAGEWEALASATKKARQH